MDRISALIKEDDHVALRKTLCELVHPNCPSRLRTRLFALAGEHCSIESLKTLSQYFKTKYMYDRAVCMVKHAFVPIYLRDSDKFLTLIKEKSIHRVAPLLLHCILKTGIIHINVFEFLLDEICMEQLKSHMQVKLIIVCMFSNHLWSILESKHKDALLSNAVAVCESSNADLRDYTQQLMSAYLM